MGKQEEGKQQQKIHRRVLQLQSWKEIREVYLCQNSLKQNISAELKEEHALLKTAMEANIDMRGYKMFRF